MGSDDESTMISSRERLGIPGPARGRGRVNRPVKEIASSSKTILTLVADKVFFKSIQKNDFSWDNVLIHLKLQKAEHACQGRRDMCDALLIPK